jgi:hypothetical protein
MPKAEVLDGFYFWRLRIYGENENSGAAQSNLNKIKNVARIKTVLWRV